MIETDWENKYNLCKIALDACIKLYIGDLIFEGWLSPEAHATVKIHGKFGYRELDALIKKLEIDRETFQNIEWIQPFNTPTISARE